MAQTVVKMGIAQTDYNKKMFLRKYRWLFTMHEPGDTSPIEMPSICYISSRPKLSFNDQAVNHVHETFTYPVRAQWEPIDISYHNVATDGFFWSWVKKCIEPTKWGYFNSIVYSCRIRMVNGFGVVYESWWLDECWPSAVDFGELDMGSNEIADVRITLKYTRATMEIS